MLHHPEHSDTARRMAAILDSAPMAILMVDASGEIVLVNAETEKLFGYTRAELIGCSVESLVPSRFRRQHPEMRKRFLGHPEARRMGAGRDLFALRKDGTEFPVEIGLNPIETEEGVFVLSAVVDITERKQFELALRRANEELEARVAARTAQIARQAEELQRSNEALERSNAELQQFAYIASHDLQSPLRSISGFVQLLAAEYGEKLDDRAKDWIHRTVESIRRLHMSIHDLLEYSRVDAEMRRFLPVNMEAVFEEVVQQLDGTIRESDAEVTSGPLPTVMGEKSQLVQLLQNLIANALKYRGEKSPVVHVSAVREKNGWIFAVKDNGIGIEPRYHERIFEIFKRLHTYEQFPGTGIGLAVCRRVVHRHLGRLWVESELGKGSTFRFSIPERRMNDDAYYA